MRFVTGWVGRTLVTALALPGCVFITDRDVDERFDLLNPPPLPGDVLVQVLDEAGFPMVNASVSVDGVEIGTTDAAGFVEGTGLPAGWHPVSVSAANHVTTGGAVEVISLGTHPLVLRMVRTSQGVVHRPATGGALRGELGALLVDGDAFEGAQNAVTVDHAFVDPAERTSPLPFAATTTTPVPVDLVSVVWIGGARDGGAAYPFSGTGTIRLPSDENPTLKALPDPKVYHFDPDLGLWIDTGSPSWDGDDLMAPFDEGGWWAVGADSSMGCLNGTLPDLPAGTLIQARVEGRPAPTSTWSDADGRFCASAPAGSPVTLDVFGADLVRGRRFGAMLERSGPERIGDCGDRCTDLGAVPTTSFWDNDQDGIFAGRGGDCEDDDEAIAPGVIDLPGDGIDADCDRVDGVDSDHDGVDASLDCDDADERRSPNRREVCDDLDNDCNDKIDDDVDDAIADPNGGCIACDPSAVVDLGPKAFFTFRELGSTTPDSSGYGHDAVVNGIERSIPSLVADGVSAPVFEGTTASYARVDQFEQMGTDQLSISMFIRPTLLRRAILTYSVEPEGVETLECASNSVLVWANPGQLAFWIRDWTLAIPRTSTIAAWEHYVLTWRESGQVELYRNGVRIFDGEMTNEFMLNQCPEDHPTITTGWEPEVVVTTIKPGGTLFLGQEQDCPGGCTDTAQAYEGALDEVAIFDRVLTQTDVNVLYASATCGEGAECNGLDDDSDGVRDEHLLGSAAECDARNCEQIVANDAAMGDGSYWVDFDGLPVFTECSFAADGSECECRICGDRIISDDDHETCDDASATCVQCAKVVEGAEDCADVQALGNFMDGPYWVTFDHKDPVTGETAPRTSRVMCDLDPNPNDGGWTLLVNQDTRAGTAFYDPTDPRTYLGNATGLFDWRAANLDNPFSGTYSILGDLSEFSACDGGWEFRMSWPFDDVDPIVWRQTNDPTADQAMAGFQKIQVPSFSTPFTGLQFGYGETADPPNFIEDTPGEPRATALMNSGFDAARGAAWYPIGVYPRGAPGNLTYRLWASDDISPDGTVRGSQLWVRPCD